MDASGSPSKSDSKIIDYILSTKASTYIEAKYSLVDFFLKLQIHHKSSCPGLAIERQQHLSNVGTDCEKLALKRVDVFELAQQEQFEDGAKAIKDQIEAFNVWLDSYPRRRATFERSIHAEADKALDNLGLSSAMKKTSNPRQLKPIARDRKSQKPRFSVEE